MSVNNGQQANQTTFNGAFISRTTDSDTVAVVGLKNPLSGGDINNAQQQINDNKTLSTDNKTRLDNLSIDDCTDVDTTTNPPALGSNLRWNGTQWVPALDWDNIELIGAGEITWDLGTETLSLSQNIFFTYGNFNKEANQVDAQTILLDDDGDIAYVDLNTTNDTPTSLTVTVVDLASWVEAENRLIFARREGNNIYFGVDDPQLLLDGDIYDFRVSAGSAINVTAGSTDADKVIKTNSDGFLDKTFNNTIPSYVDEAAFVTALGRAAIIGDRFFDTTVSALKIHDGTQFVISSGSGDGEINFLENGKAEINTDGWITFADAAASRPVDGTGGTANITWTRTTASPLAGDGSFLLTKDAVNRQGEGVSYDFSIDSTYKARVLNIESDYIINSGTFVAGSNTTDSDVIFYLYDVTNAKLIEPSSFKLLSNSSTLSDRFRATFQTSPDSTEYRLIIYVASTSAAAYSVKFDNIKVSPSNYVYGTPITDWTTFVPTGSWTTNTTYFGRYRRIGDSAEIQYSLLLSGAPNAADLSFNLPPGLSADEGKFTATSTKYLGSGIILDNGSRIIEVDYSYGVSNLVTAVYIDINATTNAVSQTNPITFASGDRVDALVTVPITGWSSSVQMSDSADTRVVTALVTRTATQSIPNATNTKVQLNSVISDSHAAFDTSLNRYNILSSGYYDVSAFVLWNAVFNGTANILQIFKNGSGLITIDRTGSDGTRESALKGSAKGIELKAGDYLELFIFQNSGISRDIASGLNGLHFSVSKATGPSSIAASETIACRYKTSSGVAIADTGDIVVPFNTKQYDSHSAYNTANGKFTAPIGGKYKVSSSVWFQSVAYVGTNSIYASVYVNGVIYSYGPLITVLGSPTAQFSCHYNDTLSVLAGDEIELRVRNSRAGGTNLEVFDTLNYLSIERVGN